MSSHKYGTRSKDDANVNEQSTNMNNPNTNANVHNETQETVHQPQKEVIDLAEDKSEDIGENDTNDGSSNDDNDDDDDWLSDDDDDDELSSEDEDDPDYFPEECLEDKDSEENESGENDSGESDEEMHESDGEVIEESGDENGHAEESEDGNDRRRTRHANIQFIPGMHQMMLIFPPQPPPPPPRERYSTDEQPKVENKNGEPPKKRPRGEEYAFINGMTSEEKAYWRNLDEAKKTEFMEVDKRMKAVHEKGKMPWRFKFLSSDVDVTTKAIILAKLDQFQNMHEGSGEYYKLRNWLQCIARLPLGTYNPLPVSPSDPFEKVATFLKQSKDTLDSKVFGHTDAKSQLMRIFAQWISNPNSKGHCIGIQGEPGVGKTHLVKNGICKALGLPFGFVALGGASDASFLEGHGFTYEGSTYGKIAEILMKTQCMNPVLFFDELDKVSTTSRGEEIIGVLTHLTDSTQNERFTDRYLGGVELNLSRALIIFSYNDETTINPILKDRMITIRVKGYNLKEKMTIARDYLLPEILAQYNLTTDDIKIPLAVIETIVQRVPQEHGVRNLKRGLESIVSWLNMHRYVPPENDELDTKFPLTVTEGHIHKYLYVSEDPMAMRPEVARMMYL